MSWSGAITKNKLDRGRQKKESYRTAAAAATGHDVSCLSSFIIYLFLFLRER